MKKSFVHLMIFIMILCLFPGLVWGKTGYVSDRLVLNFRQEPDSTSAVLKVLKSDTPVNVLGEETEFYKIELQSKEIGWVEKNFIVFDLPKTIMIDQLKQENDRLKDRLSQLSLLETGLKEIAETLFSGKDIKDKDLIKNIQDNLQTDKRYQKETAALLKQIDVLEKKQKDFLKIGMIKWFIAGVGVLLLGWIMGQSVSSRKRQPKSSLLG